MKMVDSLLRLGARVDLCDDIGGPIGGACGAKEYEIARKLIKVAENQNLDVGLHYLIMANASENIEKIIKKKPNMLNQTCDVPDCGKYAISEKRLLPLSIAVAWDKWDKGTVVETLIRLGARTDLDDELGGPIAATFKDNNYKMAKKLIRVADDQHHNVDAGKLLDILFKGYQEHKFVDDADGETIYELMFLLDQFQKKRISSKPSVPLFHRIVKLDRARNVFKWIIEEKGEDSFDGLDPEGNNVLMAFIDYLKSISKNVFVSLCKQPETELFLKLLNRERYDLTHKNAKGETLLTRTIDLGDRDVANAVLKELDKRKFSVSEFERNRVEQLKDNKDNKENTKERKGDQPEFSIEDYLRFVLRHN